MDSLASQTRFMISHDRSRNRFTVIVTGFSTLEVYYSPDPGRMLSCEPSLTFHIATIEMRAVHWFSTLVFFDRCTLNRSYKNKRRIDNNLL